MTTNQCALRFLLLTVGGWVHRQQQDVIECLIEGALKNLCHRVAPSAIAKILKENGIKPAPDWPTPWRVFLRAHWGQFAATDFFKTEV